MMKQKTNWKSFVFDTIVILGDMFLLSFLFYFSSLLFTFVHINFSYENIFFHYVLFSVFVQTPIILLCMFQLKDYKIGRLLIASSILFLLGLVLNCLDLYDIVGNTAFRIILWINLWSTPSIIIVCLILLTIQKNKVYKNKN